MKQKIPIQYLNFNNRKMKHIGEGSYGSFYKYSKYRGVKILDIIESYDSNYGYRIDRDFEGFSTINLLKKSSFFRDAKREFKLLRRAYKTKKTPRPYSVAIVKMDDKYFVGITMRYIHGVLLEDLSYNHRLKYNTEEQIEDIVDLLLKVGLDHTDLHDNNLIFEKKTKKLYAIDFSPEHIE